MEDSKFEADESGNVVFAASASSLAQGEASHLLWWLQFYSSIASMRGSCEIGCEYYSAVRLAWIVVAVKLLEGYFWWALARVSAFGLVRYFWRLCQFCENIKQAIESPHWIGWLNFMDCWK